MALGDYILCHKCETKLIYDGDRGNRLWWKERYGAEPEIKCPKCSAWVGLTDEEIKEIIGPWGPDEIKGFTRKLFDEIDAKLKEKNHEQIQDT